MTAAGSALLLAGCSSSSAPSRGKSSTTSTVQAVVTPPAREVAVTIPGTAEHGSTSFLGSAERLLVFPVRPGSGAAGAAGGSSGSVLPSSALSQPGPVSGSGVEIAYRQLGSGPPLLLVAGQHASMATWSPELLKALAGHYRVTLFDLPSVGYSGPSQAALTLGSLADLTAGLIGELRLSQPLVLGWGLGGQVGVALAERHPGLVGELVLADSGLAVGGCRQPTGSAAAVLASGSASTGALAGVLFPPRAAVARELWLSAVAEQVPDVVTEQAISAESLLERSAWHDRAVVSGLSSLHLPVLVVAGSKDPVFGPADARALAAAIKGSQLFELSGAGYGAVIQDPPRILALLEQFTS